MYCADAGTGQHGYQSLGHHGHVDDYSIAAADIISRKYAGKKSCLFEQFRVR
jgi:putative heme iron utilization protein